MIYDSRSQHLLQQEAGLSWQKHGKGVSQYIFWDHSETCLLDFSSSYPDYLNMTLLTSDIKWNFNSCHMVVPSWKILNIGLPVRSQKPIYRIAILSLLWYFVLSIIIFCFALPSSICSKVLFLGDALYNLSFATGSEINRIWSTADLPSHGSLSRYIVHPICGFILPVPSSGRSRLL